MTCTARLVVAGYGNSLTVRGVFTLGDTYCVLVPLIISGGVRRETEALASRRGTTPILSSFCHSHDHFNH